MVDEIIKVKCKSCGAVVDIQDKDGNVSNKLLGSFLILALCVGNAYWAYRNNSALDNMREDVKAALSEEFKDECWVTSIQKEMDLPPPTDEERWCESHGHCGIARQSLASEVGHCHDELKFALSDLKKLSKEIVSRREYIEDVNQEVEELTREIDFYTRRSIETVCAEQMFECENTVDLLIGYRDECETRSYEQSIYVDYLSHMYMSSSGEPWSKEDAHKWFDDEIQ